MENGVILFASVKVNSLVLQKAVLFTPETTVKEAMEQIALKCSLPEHDVAKGYLMFIPSKTGGEGTYLYNLDSKILHCHSFNSRDVVEMRQAAFSVVINFQEEDHKQPPLDLEMSVFELLQKLCKQFQCGSYHHFELCLMNSPVIPPKILIGNKTLGSQAVMSNTTIYMRKKNGISRLFSRSTEKKQKKSSSTAKESKKIDGDPIFGQPLSNALRRSGEVSFSVPPIVTHAIEYIEHNAMDVEGIFRKPGIAMQIEELKSRVNSTEVDPDFTEVTDPHLVCSLLKQYLRDLPEPIIPFSLYDQFMELADTFENGETKEGEEKLIALGKQLPISNYNLLKKLTTFLLKVSTFEPQNKMSARNLATVFGPNLLRANTEDMLIIMRDSHRINEITFQLISLSTSVFPDPISKTIRPISMIRAEQKESKRRRGTFTPSATVTQYMGYCKVLIEFPSFDNGLAAIKCKEGDVIAVVQMLESGWGYGKLYNEETEATGFFPSNYCSSIVTTIADLNILDDEVVVSQKPPSDDLETMFISQFQAHCDDLFQQFSLLTSMLSN